MLTEMFSYEKAREIIKPLQFKTVVEYSKWVEDNNYTHIFCHSIRKVIFILVSKVGSSLVLLAFKTTKMQLRKQELPIQIMLKVQRSLLFLVQGTVLCEQTPQQALLQTLQQTLQ